MESKGHGHPEKRNEDSIDRLDEIGDVVALHGHVGGEMITLPLEESRQTGVGDALDELVNGGRIASGYSDGIKKAFGIQLSANGGN